MVFHEALKTCLSRYTSSLPIFVARCTLDCGFKTSESPALRGFVGGPLVLAPAVLYLVLKSNGYKHPEIGPKKFEFSLKTTSMNLAKKLPPQLCYKTFLIAFFNFSHKRPTFVFTHESGYTLDSSRKIAHSASHAEIRGFTLVQPCRAFDRPSPGKRTAGKSGCTPMACVRFFRRRSLAGLRNLVVTLPMLRFLLSRLRLLFPSCNDSCPLS